jgi:hypothetical protein
MSYPAFVASSNQQELKQEMFGEFFIKKTKSQFIIKSEKTFPQKCGGCIRIGGSGSLLHTDSTKALLASFFLRLPNCPPNQDVSGDDPLAGLALVGKDIVLRFSVEYISFK